MPGVDTTQGKNNPAVALLTFSCTALLCAGIAPAWAETEDELADSADGIVLEEAFELEEVVVTARRIEEIGARVPLTIRLIEEEQIIRTGVNDLDDVARLVPGLTFDLGGFPNDTRPAVRGMQSERGRPSVAIMLDGLDLSGENLAIAGGTAGVVVDLLDLERIEVVKGPQTTLYGRNAFAGAINYISRKPTDYLEGRLTVEAAEFGQRRLVGMISGPIGDGTVSYRLNAAYREGDGFFTNPVNGGPLGAEEFEGFAGALRFRPENWDITVRYQTSSTDNSDYPTAFIQANTRVPVPDGTFTPGPPGTPPLPCPPDLSGLPPQVVQACTRGTVVGPIEADINDVQMGVNELTGQPPRGLEVDQQLFTVDAIWESDFGTWHYNLGWIDNDSFVEADGDFSSFPAPPGFVLSLSALQLLDYEDERLDNNLWWTGSAGQFDLLLGAQYLDEESTLVNSSAFWLRDPGSPFGGPPFFLATQQIADDFPVSTRRKTEYLGLYGAVKWNITDRWRLGLEARRNSDDISYDISGWRRQDTSLSQLEPVCLPGIPQGATFMGVPGPDVPPPGTVQACPQRETLSYNEWTPRITLDWDWRENVLLFANAARGFKPGGFSTLEVIDFEGQGYRPEFVDAYELGFKSQWLDNKLSIDASVFYNDYTDQQIGAQRVQSGAGDTVLVVPAIINAASVEAKGVELAADWFLGNGLRLTLAYAYTDAEFAEYVQGPAPTTDESAYIACGVPIGQSSSPQIRAEAGNACADFSGNAVAKNPEHAMNIGAIYRGLVGDRGTSWFVEANAQYRSKRFVDAANLSWVPSFTLVDLQAGLEFEKFSVVGFVTNVTDDDTIRVAQRNVDPGNPEGFAPSRAVVAYLPEPRVAGLRVIFEFGL